MQVIIVKQVNIVVDQKTIMPKHFHCSGCGGQHKRPVGAKCQFKSNYVNISGSASINVSNVSESVNQDIISALSAVSSRLEAIEK